MRRIKKAEIRFVSLVPKGANKLAVLMKEDGGLELPALSKFDELKGELTAVVYAPELKDSQGEVASAEVIKDMAHDFARHKGDLDIRHGNVAVARDKAAIVETFVIQQGDKRFADMKTSEGTPVDVTGGWGVVVQVDDPELKRLYASGAWKGVSMGGRYLETEDVKKEDLVAALLKHLTKSPVPETTPPKGHTEADVTKEEVEALLKANTEALLKSIDEKLAKSAPAAAPKPEGFKGDLTKIADVRQRLVEIEREKLAKSLDLNDEDALRVHLATLEKQAEEKLLKETPEQKCERLQKEVAARDAKIAKLQKASNVPATAGDESPLSKGGELTDEQLTALGRSMGKSENVRRGFAVAGK